MQKKKKRKKNSYLCCLKGAIPALIFTMAAILVFALIVKSADVSDGAVITVDHIIKVAGCSIAALICAANASEKLPLKGAIASLAYTVIGFLLFSIINKSMGDVFLLLTDSIMALLIGALCGVLILKVFKNNDKQLKKA